MITGKLGRTDVHKSVISDLASHVSRKTWRDFSLSRKRYAYADTVSNLKIGKHTRVIFQGFTGRQATQNAKQSLEYGTKIVGGVTPGKTSEHLGLPVLPTVRAAKEQLNPDATAVYVAAGQAASAIEEAIEAEIPLIVAVAEHIPLHDMLRVQSMLRSQLKSRLVGANSPGMISAVGNCRLGFHPLPIFKAGCIGIVAKSGTLSYETVASTTRAGLGQSLVIGMGGDPLPGTDFVDALQVFEHDDDTKGIILVGEIGGRAEDNAAEWIREYRKRCKDPKPIMALIAGIQAPQDRVMGHAGAIVRSVEKTALQKVKALENAGAVITNHPSKVGGHMAQLLDIGGGATNGQKRSHYTFQRPVNHPGSTASIQKRSIHLSDRGCAIDRLAENPLVRSIPLSVLWALSSFEAKKGIQYLEFGVDRDLYKLKVTYGLGKSRDDPVFAPHINFGEQINIVRKIFPDMPNLFPPANGILASVIDTFYAREAYTAAVYLSKSVDGTQSVEGYDVELDDAAFRKQNNIKELLNLKKWAGVDSEEIEAEKDEIVYIKLRKGAGNIGTLGLAMNTVDAISDLGGSCANFLDTGGKATSETVKSSFRVVLKDPRVKVVFVNIFGGLTLCDMIAEGMLLAYKDLGIKVPAVVRLRGTNEKEGQKIIAESGLELHAFDDFDEAASKAIGLARQGE